MKLFSTIILLVLTFFSQENFRLNGDYKVVFNDQHNPSNLQSYSISFNDSSYVKTLPNGERIKGVIQYGNHIGYLRDYLRLAPTAGKPIPPVLNNQILMEFKKSNKDTIPFSTKSTSNLHISLNSGNLIRIK